MIIIVVFTYDIPRVTREPTESDFIVSGDHPRSFLEMSEARTAVGGRPQMHHDFWIIQK